MDATVVRDLGREHLRQVKVLLVKASMAKLPPATQRLVTRSYHTRIAHEQEVWGKTLDAFSDKIHEQLDIDGAIHLALTSWGQPTTKWFGLRKATPPTPPGGAATDQQGQQQGSSAAAQALGFLPPPSDALKTKLAAGINEASLVQGGAQMYVGIATKTAEEAGQMSLAHMGINKTFAFASPANTAQDLFAPRGSKIIQQMYGDHIDTLTQMIKDATDPRHPKTIQEVRKTINEQWPGMKRYQVDRIARTETAAVWTATSANTYSANGISSFESTIATGPSIGVESEDPCDECVDEAASIHSMDDDLPPWHPNCRCEIVPSLEDENGVPWLPPDEPFTGGDTGPQLPVCGSDVAMAAARKYRALLKMRHTTIRKAAASCLAPMPEPGQPLGGITYHTIDTTAGAESNYADVYSLKSEIGGWSDAQASTAAMKVLSDSVVAGESVLVARDTAGFAVSFAGYEETSVGINISGLASRSGGARKLLPSFAQRAVDTNRYLHIAESGMSPALRQTLVKMGWKENSLAGKAEGLVLETPADMKAVYPHLNTPKLPQADAPVVPQEAPVAAPAPLLPPLEAPAPGMPADLPAGEFPLPSSPAETQAAITSCGNKISGLKTRIKAENQAIAAGKETPGKLADLNHRLSQQIAYRDNLKAHLKGGDGSAVPTASTTATDVAVPVVPDVPPVQVPAENVADYAAPNKTWNVVPGGVKKETGTGKLTSRIKVAADRPGQAKADIMRDITRRLENVGGFDASAVRRAFGYSANLGGNETESVVSSMIQNWARTSSDADARGVAMQQAASEEFGLVDAFAASYAHDKTASAVVEGKARDLLDGKLVYDSGMSGGFIEVSPGKERPIRGMLKAFMRAQYEATQELLKSEGIKEITVYRGLRPVGEVPWNVGVSVIEVLDNPLASWSTKISVSKRFGTDTMLRASVPAESILSTPLTGFGCSNEYECVVMNHGDNKVWAVRQGSGPMSESRLSELRRTVELHQSKLTEQETYIKTNFPGARQVDGGMWVAPALDSYELGRFDSASATYRSLQYTLREQKRLLDRGTESFHWSTETELIASIKQKLDENAALAGKPLGRQPKITDGSPTTKVPLTPEKQARNKVSSAKHALKVEQEKLAEVPGGQFSNHPALNAQKLKVAAAQQKYEQTQLDLQALLDGNVTKAVTKAMPPRLAALYRSLSQG